MGRRIYRCLKEYVWDVWKNTMTNTVYVTLTVFDSRKGIGVITIYKDDLEESKIREIKNVEFKLEMEDTDTMDDILTTDVIKFPVE